MYDIGFLLKEIKTVQTTDYLRTGCEHIGCHLRQHVEQRGVGGQEAGKGEFGYDIQ
jgi:hypothetical protein